MRKGYNKMDSMRRNQYSPLKIKDLVKILGLTVKKDNVNKVITFLACLSAYTENSQLNISFNAPSSSGKSYIPSELVSLFPKKDVRELGYVSAKAFFHDEGKPDPKTNVAVVDLERKILVFLDQPHQNLLEYLRPILSHDRKEVNIKITDKNRKGGLKTKNIIIRGYPAVIFCTAKLMVDEQEATRFILLSPETSQDKLRKSIEEVLLKETDEKLYRQKLHSNPARRLLMQRIRAIKEERIKNVKIHAPEKIGEWFYGKYKRFQPRHARDMKRLIYIVKCYALLNLWHRRREGSIIHTSDVDIKAGIILWKKIAISQEYNLPPYVYNILKDVIEPIYKKKLENPQRLRLEGQESEPVNPTLTRKEILEEYYQLYGRPLDEWKLRKEILPMLERSGLIRQENDALDKRQMVVIPIELERELSGYDSKDYERRPEYSQDV